MATQIQWRRGNTAQTATFTGAVAEITVDTDKKTLVVHDGSTSGGIPLAKESTTLTIFNHANGAFDKANSANIIAQSAFDKANQTAQLAFTTVSANGTNLVADANNDTLTITSAVANGVFVTGVAGTDTLDIGLIDSGVTASGYGDNVSIPTYVVDAKGRLTSASNTSIRSGTTSVTGIVQLEDSVISTSTSNAATPASVKTAYDLANTANTNAVNAGTYANAAFDKANSANVLAQSGYNQANTATTTAGLAYTHANGAFDKANSANSLAQQVFDFANTISGGAATDNVARTTASAAFVQANAAFTQANSNYISAVTRLDVTNSGASAYLIDQYSGNNPAVYVTAGETISFYLNVSGHPFMIRLSNGGTNYNTGLIHVATDGTVSTGSSAQGKVSGTLYFKVPAELAGNTYVYQCSAHSGMVGNINFGQPNSTIFAHANAAFAKANSANVIAQAAFDNSNTKFSSSGGSISGDTTVTGNLTVVGQTVYANTTTLLIADNILTLNAAIGQSSPPTVNAGLEVDRGSSANVELLWNETLDKWVFSNDGSSYSNIAGEARLDTAYAHANAAFDLANGTAGVANTDVTNISTTAGVYGNASHIPVTTLSANGRVSSITNTSIAISTTQITSGVLSFAQGGANATSYTTGQLLVSNGTSIISLANTGTAGTYGNSSFVPVITTDAYGRISSVTNTAITGFATTGDSLALAIALG